MGVSAHVIGDFVPFKHAQGCGGRAWRLREYDDVLQGHNSCDSGRAPCHCGDCVSLPVAVARIARCWPTGNKNDAGPIAALACPVNSRAPSPTCLAHRGASAASDGPVTKPSVPPVATRRVCDLRGKRPRADLNRDRWIQSPEC